MRDRSVTQRRIAASVALWLLLYLGVSATLFGLFSLTRATPAAGSSVATVAFALGAVVTFLAFLAVVIDRLLFTREPTGFLTRQSVWVLALVILTIAATAAALVFIDVTPGNAVLLGITTALPTTMVLFAAVNFVRYRSMEYRA